MAPFIILVAALLINTLSNCTAESVYCVTPTTTSCSSCPHTFIKCTTLSEFVQEAKSFFADSNITMLFLPGDHILDTNVTVSNVVRLTMRGESSSGNKTTIVCSRLVGFSFTSTVELKIDSLAFTSCSRKYCSSSFSSYALLLQSTQHTELVNCSFHDKLGTALVVDNTTVTLAGNTVFTHNYCDSDTCIGGGCIVALDSNIAFMGNTTFFENKATFHNPYKITSGGGAISASNNAVLSFNGTSNFIGNTIVYGLGGAIFASDKVSVEIAPSSGTQLLIIVMVVQFMCQTMLQLFSMETPTSSPTQQILMVGQFMQQETLYLVSMEPTTSSTSQEPMEVVQFMD